LIYKENVITFRITGMYMFQETHIIVDSRERNLGIIEGLAENNVTVTFAQLPVGDYIISDRMCVERKTEKDFERSIIDTRLFEQASRFSRSFQKPILIIEGNSGFSLDENVIIGTTLRLYTDFNIQILRSDDERHTAYMLAKFAEKEQTIEEREPRILGSKKAYSLRQWQLLMLGSMPGVGTKLAGELIRHFGSIRGVANAGIDDLVEVRKIGKKKAGAIYRVINAGLEGELDGDH
jgi:Fanconi anemia group M protein